MKLGRSFVLLFLLVILLCSCRDSGRKLPVAAGKKLTVIASLFPIYDFAKNIAGDHGEVLLLLPPGVEPHSFEPRPADMFTLNNAALFLYTNSSMEPWVRDLLKGLQNPSLLVLETGRTINLHKTSGEYDESGHDEHHHKGMDPHIWLDFSNAEKMVDVIMEGFIAKDPANRESYQRNAEAYKKKLNALDEEYKKVLAGCRKKIIISGGHSAFSYLAQRYGLHYLSAYGVSPNAEPTPRDIISLTKTLRENDVSHIFFEELITPRVAETISKETGARLLLLHGGHNISKDEHARGVTFLMLMEKNLEALKEGLQCRER